MKTGERIRLGEHEYRIVQPLGAGYLAQVYQAERLLDHEMVAVKVLKEEHLTNYRARAQFEEESQVLTLLAEAEQISGTHYIVRLYDAGQDREGRLYQVQELAAGRPVVYWLSLPEETRLEISAQFAHLLEITHGAGVALPDMKIDEIFWDGASIQVVDWNLTRQGEEEQQRDLFRFGALMHHLFAERELLVNTDAWQVEGELGFGVPLPRWQELSYGTRAIIARAVHRDVARRYQTAQELRQDVLWQQENLRLAQARNLAELEARAGEARWKERWDNTIAACELALPIATDAESQRRLERLRDEAKDELEKEVLRPLSRGQAKMGARRWATERTEHGEDRGAIQEFESALRLDPTNRPARYFLSQARIGLHLDTQQESGSEQIAVAWQATQQVVHSLIRGEYELAEEWLSKARELLPEVWELEQLAGAIQAGYLVREAEGALREGNFDGALERLKHAQVQAPGEAWIRGLQEQVELERERAARITGLLTDARAAFEEERYDAAVERYEEVLRLEPTHPEARRERDTAKERKRVDDLFQRGKRACREGELARAEELLGEASRIHPAHDLVKRWDEAVNSFLREPKGEQIIVSEPCRQRLATEAAMLFAQGSYAEAQQRLEEAFELIGAKVAEGNANLAWKTEAEAVIGSVDSGVTLADDEAMPVFLPAPKSERDAMLALYRQILDARDKAEQTFTQKQGRSVAMREQLDDIDKRLAAPLEPTEEYGEILQRLTEQLAELEQDVKENPIEDAKWPELVADQQRLEARCREVSQRAESWKKSWQQERHHAHAKEVYAQAEEALGRRDYDRTIELANEILEYYGEAQRLKQLAEGRKSAWQELRRAESARSIEDAENWIQSALDSLVIGDEAQNLIDRIEDIRRRWQDAEERSLIRQAIDSEDLEAGRRLLAQVRATTKDEDRRRELDDLLTQAARVRDLESKVDEAQGLLGREQYGKVISLLESLVGEEIAMDRCPAFNRLLSRTQERIRDLLEKAQRCQRAYELQSKARELSPRDALSLMQEAARLDGRWQPLLGPLQTLAEIDQHLECGKRILRPGERNDLAGVSSDKLGSAGHEFLKGLCKAQHFSCPAAALPNPAWLDYLSRLRDSVTSSLAEQQDAIRKALRSQASGLVKEFDYKGAVALLQQELTFTDATGIDRKDLTDLLKVTIQWQEEYEKVYQKESEGREAAQRGEAATALQRWREAQRIIYPEDKHLKDLLEQAEQLADLQNRLLCLPAIAEISNQERYNLEQEMQSAQKILDDLSSKGLHEYLVPLWDQLDQRISNIHGTLIEYLLQQADEALLTDYSAVEGFCRRAANLHPDSTKQVRLDTVRKRAHAMEESGKLSREALESLFDLRFTEAKEKATRSSRLRAGLVPCRST